MTMKRTHILPIAAGVLALGALAGCTSAPGASSTGTPSATANGGSNPIPTIPTGTGIISGTKMTSCDTTGTAVTAKGTVTMPEGKSGDVVISVSWVNSKNSSVYGRGVTTLEGVGTGDKKDWTTTATIPEGAESVSCVLGAVIPE